jgi:subtilase family protein
MSAEHKVIYFQPGQLIFLVDGEWNGESEKALRAWANPIMDRHEMKMSEKAISLTFPPTLQQPTNKEEKVSLQEKSERKKPYISPKVAEHNSSFTVMSVDITGLETDPKYADKLLNLIVALDNDREKALGPSRLQVVSPNWLTSGGSEPGATGGPGAKPTSFDGLANTEKFKFTLDEKLKEMIKQGRQGEDVVVAILDTAPIKYEDVDKTQPLIQRADDPHSVLAKIYETWVTQRLDDPHSLISSLLNPDKPRLTVHLNPNVDKPDSDILYDGHLQADGHKYEMTDHGLFVAGIIHSLARQAELHLYQVLNRYGVGDLFSIAQALQEVFNTYADKPLVINLSLTINIPLEKGHIPTKIYNDGYDNGIGRKLTELSKENAMAEGSEFSKEKRQQWKDWYSRQNLPAEWICDLAYAFGSRMIAAAGNNREKGQGRPQACYPAAFETALGVGALKKSVLPADSTEKLETASYSNLDDRPGGTGITTLGGEEGKGNGVLGIYLGEFPPISKSNPTPTASINGWGWWAGTSFATPIISGLAAALLTPGKTTENVIAELSGAQPFTDQDDEDVLFVTQGT